PASLGHPRASFRQNWSLCASCSSARRRLNFLVTQFRCQTRPSNRTGVSINGGIELGGPIGAVGTSPRCTDFVCSSILADPVRHVYQWGRCRRRYAEEIACCAL